MAERIRKREVGLMKLANSEFLSLVKSPSNKTGFKIIRKDDGAMQKIRIREKAKRNDSALLAISFPEGTTEEEAIQLMETFDLGEDYSVYRDEDGNYILKRVDAESSEYAQAIEMGNGFSALVDSSAIQRSDKTVTGVTLIGFEFISGQKREDVEEWLNTRDISGYKMSTEGDVTIVHRHETKEETRKIKIEEGIYAVVCRSSDTDVPEKVYRAVVDASYGNWGWGHLNFATALADPEFTDKSWDAIYILRDVLENIILYSGLPLDDRKTLLQNACEQFASYMGGLMDALPRGLIEKATNSDDKTVKQEPNDMAKKEETKVERSDATPDTDKGNENKANENTAEYVTRDELKGVVAEAVTEAMKSHVERTDENTDKVASALAALGDAVSKINENVDTVTRSVKEIKEEVDDLGGETVARSDDDDGDDTGEQETVKRDENASPFAGMFGDRFA